MTEQPPIISHGLTVEKVFEGQKYKLASYQREYTWTRAEVRALLVDLHGRFYQQWRRLQHDDTDVERYDSYYLGSIVYYRDSGFHHLVDGQQRITTLHLLLIYLLRLLEEMGTLKDLAAKVRTLIWSRPGHQFTVQIDERSDTLKSLMRNERPVVATDAPTSVRNLIKRFQDIEDEFPYTLRDEALERFVEWLLYRVCLVGIEAENKTRGWEIFETTNDRGIRLGPMDLLKSHLIGQVAVSRQKELSERWHARMSSLAGLDLKTPSEFVRDLVVAKYLKDLGEDSRAEATVAVHEWIRVNADELGLHKAVDFYNFVSDVVLKLAEYYQNLRRATERHDPGNPWAGITYLNEHNGIPFHMAAVLASLRPEDDKAEFREKARLVGSYLDLLYVRRMVNRRAMRIDSLTPEVLNLVLELRGCASVEQVRQTLAAKVAGLKDDFRGVRRFTLSPDSRAQVRYLLARITDFAEMGIGRPSSLPAYLDTSNHDIEHVVPAHFQPFQQDNPQVEEKKFPMWRNAVGALLLLPKSQNSSIGDKPYKERLEHYRDQCLLAASLHPATRQRNQAVKGFVREHSLDKLLVPINGAFGVTAIKLRQDLYQRLCEIVWDPARLGLVSTELPAAPKAESAPAVAAVAVKPMVTTPNTDAVRRLITMGRLRANETIVGKVEATEHEATVQADGTILIHGEVFPDITTAANFLREKQTRGWDFWKVRRDKAWVSLGKLRRGL